MARAAQPKPAAEADGDSRERLLAAAQTVFARRGYRGASIDEIVREAGLSKGTLYWNFTSKAELFEALLEERIDAQALALMEMTASAPADVPTAPDVSRGLATLFREQSEAMLLFHEYWLAATREGELRPRFVAHQRRLRAALARMLERRHAVTGVPLVVPAEHVARGLVAMAVGLSIDYLVEPDEVPDQLYGEMLDLVYEGIGARA